MVECLQINLVGVNCIDLDQHTQSTNQPLRQCFAFPANVLSYVLSGAPVAETIRASSLFR